MKIIAVLEVNKERLAETGGSFEQEMGWVEQSGIQMVEYQEYEGRYEYASFVWSRSRCQYIQVNREVYTRQLCENRLQEYIAKGWLGKDYDTSKVVIKRRLATSFISQWEEAD